MSTSATLEGIWEDFKIAREEKDLERMKMCLKEFDLEYNPVSLPKYAPQKQMARRAAMTRRIELFGAMPTYEAEASGTW